MKRTGGGGVNRLTSGTGIAGQADLGMEPWSMPDHRPSRFLLCSLALGAVGLCWGTLRIHDWGVPEIRQATVVDRSRPQTLAEARGNCPIPLPATASNIQYVVWAFGEVTQSWVRFEASATACLEHAEQMVEPFKNREGYRVATTPVSDDTGRLCVLDPTEVDLAWFDPDSLSTGLVFCVSGGRAPMIWVDTEQGCFYCEVKNACHSMSPP